MCFTVLHLRDTVDLLNFDGRYHGTWYVIPLRAYSSRYDGGSHFLKIKRAIIRASRSTKVIWRVTPEGITKVQDRKIHDL